MFFKKTIRVPETNDTKVVESVQLWEVRWNSRYGEFSSNIQPEIEVFTSEEKAKEFQKSLLNAFKLIRYTSCNKVTLIRAK